MWITFAKTPQAETKGSLVGQQSRDLLCLPAVMACRGPHTASFKLLGDGLERTGGCPLDV